MNSVQDNEARESRTTVTQDFSHPATQETSTNRFEVFESQRRQRNQTVWTNELVAQRHEELFTQLWDDLRNQTDAYLVSKQFQFGELLLGTPTESTPHENNIWIRHFSTPVHSVLHADWPRFLDELKQAGYRLEQSDWRHPKFSVSTNGLAESVIAMTLHVSNPEKKERYVVRGNLLVNWRQPTQSNERPFPELIDASRLELISRQGEPPFHHVVAADITPEKIEAHSLEPCLQLYDLDGDGLSEIILANRNRVFWNRGHGEFQQDQLVAFPLPALGASLIADFDNDGHADLLAADTHGLALFSGDERGRFLKPAKRIRFTGQDLINPIVITAGDIDGDGDLDVWLAQYKIPYQGGQVPTPFYDANDGHPSFLLINDGHGNFRDATEEAGLAKKRFRRTYSSSFVDLDNDGDLDLVVVSDFAGVDVYYNDGHGKFTDMTSRVIDEPHSFGMAQTFGDFDRDGQMDFFVIGMNSFVADRLDSMRASVPGFPEFARMRTKMAHGNRLYFQRGGRFQQTPSSDRVAHSGWSWGATSGDFCNSGFLDLYIVNGHISGRSARDYDTQFWEHDIYTGSSKEDPSLDEYFRSVRSRYQASGFSYGGHEKNRFFFNQNGSPFLECGYLMGVSLEEDCRNVVSDDLDGDGKLDLLVTTFEVSPKFRQTLHLFPNFTENAGNWIEVRLRESGPGFSPIGAKVILTTPTGKQIRQFVTGDSYRAQHANTAHFGIGKETQVTAVEVIWSNGRNKIIRSPKINQSFLVTPDQPTSKNLTE